MYADGCRTRKPIAQRKVQLIRVMHGIMAWHGISDTYHVEMRSNWWPRLGKAKQDGTRLREGRKIRDIVTHPCEENEENGSMAGSFFVRLRHVEGFLRDIFLAHGFLYPALEGCGDSVRPHDPQ